jgi:hypothetical protein
VGTVDRNRNDLDYFIGHADVEDADRRPCEHPPAPGGRRPAVLGRRPNRVVATRLPRCSRPTLRTGAPSRGVGHARLGSVNRPDPIGGLAGPRLRETSAKRVPTTVSEHGNNASASFGKGRINDPGRYRVALMHPQLVLNLRRDGAPARRRDGRAHLHACLLPSGGTPRAPRDPRPEHRAVPAKLDSSPRPVCAPEHLPTPAWVTLSDADTLDSGSRAAESGIRQLTGGRSPRLPGCVGDPAPQGRARLGLGRMMT